jgi:prolyl-tRNA synthetase
MPIHRWSNLFIPTLREAPADAEVPSHKYLLRAGYIRQLAAGIYSFLFLGQRSLLKITQIVREEMDRIGQEFHLPALHPRELWEESGRLNVMGENMFRLKDRKGAEMVLGMTHEEVITDIARKELRSYKQLPQVWYQIQTKFRDEPRPRSGLLRVRQFLMKDSYSFDLDAAGLDISYKKHYDAYRAMFDRCGLKYVVVEAYSGAMGGSQSHEFMVTSDAGEDVIASCAKCGYAANLEKASAKNDAFEDLTATAPKPELVSTPGKKTIEEVAAFLKVSPKQKIKTLALMQLSEDPKTGENRTRPVIVLLRGDHSLNEAKLASVLEGKQTRPMHLAEIQQVFGSPAGFLGPVGLPAYKQDMGGSATQSILLDSLPLIFGDLALEHRKNLIAGANKEDYHLRNVTPGRDFIVTQWVDLRNVEPGDSCVNCGSPLQVAKAVEIGHIFKLGDKYTVSMGASVLDKEGKEVHPIMGCYGVGMERILTAAIEQNHDDAGFWLPPHIAPFELVITPTNMQDSLLRPVALELAEKLSQAGLDVLLDDRDERPGVKFKDADLIGVPFRVTIGKKVSSGMLEVFHRSTRETLDASISDIDGIMARVRHAS